MNAPLLPRFDPARFRRALDGWPGGRSEDPARDTGGERSLGRTLVVLERAGSTQDEARDLARLGAPHGTIVFAEEQTAGRGRRGRRWESPAGQGIWATLVARGALPHGTASLLAFAGAVAACEAARDGGAASVELKWPNDLIAQGAKVGGILGEVMGEGPATVSLLGFGINVAGAPERTKTGGDRATSLRAEGLGPGAGREEVLAVLMRRFGVWLSALRRDDARGLLARWGELSPTSEGRRVLVEEIAGGRVVGGTTRGVDTEGSLILEDDHGLLRTVRFGGTLRLEEPSARERLDAARH